MKQSTNLNCVYEIKSNKTIFSRRHCPFDGAKLDRIELHTKYFQRVYVFFPNHFDLRQYCKHMDIIVNTRLYSQLPCYFISTCLLGDKNTALLFCVRTHIFDIYQK